MGPEQRGKAGPAVGLDQIAERAQLSTATVSRVLNRRPGVSPKARQAVEEALAELGYRRDLTGQVVAILTPSVRNAFFAELSEGIEAALDPYGLRTVICPVFPGTGKEGAYIQTLTGLGMAAAVFLSASNTVRSSDSSPRDILTERRIPFVCINGDDSSGAGRVFSTDDWRAAAIAVQHLVSLGHRVIGLGSGPAGNIPADRRVEGFLRELARQHLTDGDKLVIRESYTREGGMIAAEFLLERGATGLIAASDSMAIGMLAAVRRRGLSCPEDVSIIGYDGSSPLDMTDPPLTTVRQPVESLTRAVADAIMAMVGGQSIPAGEILFDPALIVRASTGPVPVSPA